jgi:Kef-type K+ transport system membrane component KefB
MSKTELGVTALTCAAVGDATAWAMLAFVVALARATGMASTFISLGLVVLFVAVMLWVVRPLLARWPAAEESNATPSRGVIASVLIFLTASALATQVIGIHALFGAFLAGAVMPRNEEFLNSITVRLENFSSVFLLPLFFAFSGLRTQVALLDDPMNWLICLGIIAMATIGKIGGSMVPARLTGMNWNDAFSLGVLMNTRGLVELIALNIGYDLGILPPRIFAMMVLMALATTFMTGPLLNLAERVRQRRGPPFAVAT